MNKIVKKTLPVLLTSAAVIVALLVLRQLWVYYMDEPWTRDAHVGADVVQVAPDVSGLVETVQVADNQAVSKGDLLFVVDRARYRIALEQAKASLAERQASVAQLRREIGRDRSLQDLVAAEDAEVRRAKLQAAQAALATAQAAVDLAELNLGRTEVRAGRRPGQRPHDARGRLRGGRQAGAGAAGHRFVPHRWLLRGNPAARRGARAARGHPPDGRVDPLRGHVESIAAGIEDRYRSNGSSLLPNVTPAFDWVRLAQRIPVRIAIDEVPKGVELIAGRTATVTVDTGRHPHNDKAGTAPTQAGL